MKDNIRILEYKDINRKFSNQTIHDFINFNMHKFIGKPFQQRQDIIDVQKHYLQNGGNFWIAVDETKNIIVGTLALEIRDKDGIVRRFYVDENYQSLGIGNRLYTALEQYAVCKTDIKTLYLACGKILKSAHQFYRKHGFEQTDRLGIEAHVSEEDDYFRKDLSCIKENNRINTKKRNLLLESLKVSQQQCKETSTNQSEDGTKITTNVFKSIEEK